VGTGEIDGCGVGTSVGRDVGSGEDAAAASGEQH
jgi:hypothetical protein